MFFIGDFKIASNQETKNITSKARKLFIFGQKYYHH